MSASGEVAVDVDPGVVLGEQGSCLFAASFGPKPLAREIIIIGFNDDVRTFTSGEEIADVFAGVVAFGNKSRGAQTGFTLPIQAIEVAPFEVKILRTGDIPDHDEVNAVCDGPLRERTQNIVRGGNGSDDKRRGGCSHRTNF